MNRTPLAALLLLISLISMPLTGYGSFFSSGNQSFGSASSTGFLPVESAFRLEGRLKATTLSLTWQIEPEHYLYRSRFSVRVLIPETTALTELSIPRGERIHDEFQGDVEILRETVQLDYQLAGNLDLLHQGVVVEVTFQGCAEAGLCYPPHTQHLNLIPD